MPRETIKSVKRKHQANLRVLNAARDAAMDRLVTVHRDAETEMRKQLASQAETIRALREDMKAESDKMSKEVGDHSLTEIALRAANDRIADLQAALTQATLVMRELGKRPEA